MRKRAYRIASALLFVMVLYPCGCKEKVEDQARQARSVQPRETGSETLDEHVQGKANRSGKQHDAPQDTSAPSEPVKLIFIHHSVGGNWLAHENGGLVGKLNENNYYVNDITYGWEPPQLSEGLVAKGKRKAMALLGLDGKGMYRIGDRTDIGSWYEWFRGPESRQIMQAVYKENNESEAFGDHKNSLENPGAQRENELIMFKSCFPNSKLKGAPDSPATTGERFPTGFSAGSEEHTVANCKRVYNELLRYFKQRPDKFFVVITPPPEVDLPQNGKAAREFSNWLVHDWLKENDYDLNNVFVFDLYNVLTSGESWSKNDAGEKTGNHHRFWQGAEQHQVQEPGNTLVYPRDGKEDNHPSREGSLKATEEFLPLLNLHYNRWQASKGAAVP